LVRHNLNRGEVKRTKKNHDHDFLRILRFFAVCSLDGVVLPMQRQGLTSYCFMVVVLIAALSACQSNQNAVSHSPSSQPTQPAQVTQPAATPAGGSSPTGSPGAPQKANKSGAPDNTPEIMKRPMTKEEMNKAMQALPPEVRARLQGLGIRPVNQGAGSPAPGKAAATPTPKK
jgi:hypothetical protein